MAKTPVKLGILRIKNLECISAFCGIMGSLKLDPGALIRVAWGILGRKDMILDTDWIQWLQEQTSLGILPTETLSTLVQQIQLQTIPANQRLVREETAVPGLYLLRSGNLESYRTSLNSAAWAVSLLPGSILHLQELLFDQPTQRTVITLSECQLGFVSTAAFQGWIQDHPEIKQILSQQLVQELAQVSAQLIYEQERQTALRPYLVPKVERGIVGSSRYAVRLRHQIKTASEDHQSVLIFGEPGQEKDNIAALIHFSSAWRREVMIKIDCSTLQASGAELFGRAGGKPGLIELVGEGTILLNNIQELPADLAPKIELMIQTGVFLPVRHLDETPVDPRLCRARFILITEKANPAIEKSVGHSIKVPPLRVRKADIKALVEYYISLYCRRRGISKPKLAPEALRRLQSYDFPSNVRELRTLVERAIDQSLGATELTEAVFWPSQPRRKQFRLNLLNTYPQLRKFLRSPWWPDRINYGLVMPLFAAVVAILLWGPQDRAHNLGLNLFWAWWWPVVLIIFPFLGRIWCAVCPFMIYGEAIQKLSLWIMPRQLGRWPRQWAERWGGWFLVGLFAAIFIWEEIWDLQNTGYLSAWLLLLITAGAVICSIPFERRFWCRYLCPIGGMNGLYGKLSMIELRAQQGICSAECTTYQCYKGGPEKGEGQETLGCPVYSHPAQLQDNKDCVLCMTCLKACPHRSVELNLRPPGIDLWTTHTPHVYEVALLLLLLGGIFLHRLPELQLQLGLTLDLDPFWPHFGISILALGVPSLIPALAQAAMHLIRGSLKPRPFSELVYGYLPLVLFGTLAHYLRLGLGEAGQILPVAWATFGLSGEGLPVLIAHPAVIAFLQGTSLVTGVLISIVLTQRIARQPLRLIWPHWIGIGGLGLSLWVLILSFY